jgi:aspartate aminotransferase
MLAEYQRRRDWLVPALNSIPGIECITPEGAFYAFPSVKGVLGGKVKTSAELATLLLEEGHVGLTAGSAFGAEGHLRISYANSLDAIKRGVEQISNTLEKLR